MSWHLAASFPVLAVDLAGLPGTFIAFGLGGLLIGFVVGVAVMRLRRTPAVIAAQSQEAARRSLAEQRYAEAEESYRKLFDSSIEGIYVTTPDGRLLNGSVSEARVWKRSLTANELQNNLCYVDPTSDGLVAYWRFNDADADGNVTDLTGHGYKAVASRSIVWVPGVRCPN